MAVTTDSPELRIDLAADASEARLVVPAAFDRARLTVEECLRLLESAGVAVDQGVRQAVQRAVNDARRTEEDRPFETVIASARPPVHGKDGWVEWRIDSPGGRSRPDDPEAGIDHYAQSPFTFVAAGDVIGQVHAPTAGQPGCDVTGATIHAADGSPVELQLDEAIQQRDDGALVARIGGVLVREGPQRVTIEPSLVIEQDVDFSTGNINFDGNVLIKGGVRDRFRVRGTGNVEVHGLIEAAIIETEGDLHAKGGFAGRDFGNVRILGDLHARYLDGIHGNVQGMLSVEREINGCDLAVHDAVQAPGGALIGGRLSVAGAVHLAQLGSRANADTELIVGRVPRLEPLAEKLGKRLDQIASRHTALKKRLQHENSAQRRRAFEAELGTLTRIRDKAAGALTELRNAIDRQRTVSVDVDKRLYPGVVLVVGHQRFHIHQELTGPLHIRCDREGQVVYQRRGGETTPLATIADLEAE